nr:hypothetical protein Iba_chr15bCG7970 [Ipomoea batatas]
MPKTATDKGDGSSTAVPTAIPTQTAPIQRQPNPRVRKQKQTCGTQPTARQSKLIPRKRKINQTTLTEQGGGSNPVVSLGIGNLVMVWQGNCPDFCSQFGNGLAGYEQVYLQQCVETAVLVATLEQIRKLFLHDTLELMIHS